MNALEVPCLLKTLGWALKLSTERLAVNMLITYSQVVNDVNMSSDPGYEEFGGKDTTVNLLPCYVCWW
jgi:hypothetical protein